MRTGRVESPVVVRAQGGALRVTVGADFDVTLDGLVEEVARGRLSPSFLRSL